MAKKQYLIEIEATDANITALKAANIDFTLYEINEVKRCSESFAGGANFATTELILRPVEEIDMTDYDPQQLKNHAAELSRNLPYKAEKIVKL